MNENRFQHDDFNPLTRIFKFRFPCVSQFNLELMYETDDREFLCKIVYTLNEVIEAVNNFGTDYKDYTDEQINLLKQYVDSQDITLKEYVDTQKSLVLQELYETKSYLENRINQLTVSFNDSINAVKGDYDYKFTQVYKYIDEQLSKYSILCVNPTSGKLEPLCKIFNDIYSALRYKAITCLEFDSSSITCGEFGSLNITASEFDVNSSLYISFKKCMCKMISPFTGYIQNITDVINDIISFVSQGISASNFDSKQLTAEDYDSKNITAYDYDFKGSIIL